MKGVINMLDARGHTATTWDTEAPETVEAARAVFDKLMGQGCTAFAMDAPGGASGTLIREFTPEVQEIVVHRALVGG